MPKFSRDQRLTLLLAAVALILAMLLLAEWAWLSGGPLPATPDNSAKTSGPVELPVTPVEDFSLPPLEAYSEMSQRPLFMENRKPGVDLPAEPPPPPPPTPMTLKLMGVVHTPGGKTALLMDAKGKYQRKRVGDKLDNWTLVELGTDRVTMQQGDKSEVLPLLKKRPKAPQVPQPQVPNPNQPPRQPIRPGQPPVAIPNPPMTEGDQGDYGGEVPDENYDPAVTEGDGDVPVEDQ